MSYKKIFVPVDDSRASLLALKEAVKIAQLSGASIYIVHVIDLAQFSWGAAAHIKTGGDIKTETKTVGDKILSQAREILDGADVKYEEMILETVGDKVSIVLAKEAEENGCDLVVMGTHGWTGVMHLLMGSVAEGVLKQSNIPVMMVRLPNE